MVLLKLKSKSKKTVVTGVSKKTDEDLKKGLLVEMQDGFSSLEVIGVGEGRKPKKDKKKKVGKREEKLQQEQVLLLGVEVVKELKEMKLSPPSYKTEVPAFVKLLTDRLNDLKNAKPVIKVEVKVEASPKKKNVEEDEDEGCDGEGHTEQMFA